MATAQNAVSLWFFGKPIVYVEQVFMGLCIGVVCVDPIYNSAVQKVSV